MASLNTLYYDWIQDYTSWLIAKSAYEKTLDVQKNIQSRVKNNIAKAIDQHKIDIQVLDKRETLIEREAQFNATTFQIKTAIRADESSSFVPITTFDLMSIGSDKSALLSTFVSSSRTYRTLSLIESETKLDVDRLGDLLLPSISLSAGYSLESDQSSLKDPENTVFGGVTLSLPFGQKQEKADVEIAKIEAQQATLSSKNTHFRLMSQLEQVWIGIKAQESVVKLAEKKASLAQLILKDETENYTFGRVTLNDYIQAVNRVDSTQFSLVQARISLQKRYIEWKRLTDNLISSFSDITP